MWDLYRPRENVSFGLIEGRDRNVTRIGQRVLWVMMPIGVAGLVVLRRRRRPLVPFVAPLVAVILTALLAYGAVRFRIPADIVLVVLVAIVIDAAIDLPRARSRAKARA
jgi:predicted RND superfamily exporter protein